MTEDDAESEEAAVELGEADSVEGAPVARVASRLTWPQEASRIVAKEGATEIRTSDGPRTLESILGEVGTTYFATRQEFLSAVRDIVGIGPVSSG